MDRLSVDLKYFARCRNQQEVKAHYRELSMEHHPDRAKQVMQEINLEHDLVKQLSDAELAQLARQAETLARAVPHLSTRERESAPQPEPAPKAMRGKPYSYIPSPQDLAAVAERQRLMALPVPDWYTLEQRQAYARAQEDLAQRAHDLDLDNARRAEQEAADRQQSEVRAAIARAMPGRW